MTLIIYRHCSQVASVSSSFSLCQGWGAARNFITASSDSLCHPPLSLVFFFHSFCSHVFFTSLLTQSAHLSLGLPRLAQDCQRNGSDHWNTGGICLPPVTYQGISTASKTTDGPRVLSFGDNMTRKDDKAVKRRPGQILERHDLAEDCTRQANLETACWGLRPTTGHNGCPMMMMNDVTYIAWSLMYIKLCWK